jgi:hypothetical protein
MLLGIKENLPPPAFIFGLYLFFLSDSYKQYARITLGVSGLYIAAAFLVLPLITGKSLFLTKVNCVQVFNPIRFIIFFILTINYWKVFFISFFPAFFSPIVLSLTLPDFIIYSHAPEPMFSPYNWHNFSILSLFFLATICGLGKLINPAELRFIPASIKKTILVISFIPMIGLIFSLPFFVYRGVKPLYNTPPWISPAGKKATIEVKKIIPAEAKLAVSPDLEIYFVNRPQLLAWFMMKFADYILINVSTEGACKKNFPIIQKVLKANYPEIFTSREFRLFINKTPLSGFRKEYFELSLDKW